MIKAVAQAASRSTHAKSRHGAMLVKGGRVLALAWNSYSKHAEIAVMKQVTADQCKRSIIWTVRIRKDGRLLLGLPCISCLRDMQAAGVKMVWYSLANGEMDWKYL